MPWTTPRTWTTGEVVTASQLNTHVRDNLDDLRTAKVAIMGRNTNLSLTTATLTAVTWNQTIRNAFSWWASGNATRITPDLAGLYLISAEARFAANATGIREARLVRSNADDIASQGRNFTVGAGGTATLSVSGMYPANGTTDYFELQVEQTSGGALNLTRATIFVAYLGT